MRFRLLGPVEVRIGDRSLPLGAPKQRLLLAALLFDGGLPSSFETLTDRLWDEDPPVRARAAFNGHVARLRRTLREAGDLTVERWPGGCTMRAPVEAVDLYRFRALVGAARGTGRAGRRADLLEQALGQWSGEPLAGLPGEWAQRVREGLERHRLAALASWAEASLRAGRHPAVIGRLTGAVERNPLAEPLIDALMRALHAAGRNPEALDLYARSCAAIIIPGRALRASHDCIERATTGNVA